MTAKARSRQLNRRIPENPVRGYFFTQLLAPVSEHPCMTLPRQVVPGRDYMVTRRCSERRFFLRPDDDTNNLGSRTADSNSDRAGACEGLDRNERRGRILDVFNCGVRQRTRTAAARATGEFEPVVLARATRQRVGLAVADDADEHLVARVGRVTMLACGSRDEAGTAATANRG